MSIVITPENYPGMNIASGVSGKRFVTYVNYGENATETNPKWKNLGGVTSNSLNISAEANAAQTKDGGYWSESAIISKSAEYSAEMILKRDNEAQAAIDAFMYDDEITAAKNALRLAVVDLDTKDYTQFWCVPSAWEMTADSGDFVTYSLTASVTGMPVKKTGFIIPTDD